MRIWLESVQFRTSDAPDNGAFPVSVATSGGKRQVVTGPEWRTGQRAFPAAFAPAPAGRHPWIDVEFRCSEQRPLSVPVRAASRRGDLLGDVPRTVVEFREGRWRGRIRLPEARLGQATRQTIRWRWQIDAPPSALHFDTPDSEHEIYTVVAIPERPWCPYGSDPHAVPWAEALDVACNWACGADSSREVLTGITRNVFRLGEDEPAKLVYGTKSFTNGRSFSLADFMAVLREGRSRISVDCADCASIVSTLSNIVGSDSRIAVLTSRKALATNPVRMIGERFARSLGFNQHETVWDVADPGTARVWDCCMGLPEGNGVEPFAGVPFGDAEFAGGAYPHKAFAGTSAKTAYPLEFVRREIRASDGGAGETARATTTSTD